MVESRVIVRYLENKFKGVGTELLPTELKALGLADQGAYLESQVFDPVASALLEELLYKKSYPQLIRLLIIRLRNRDYISDVEDVRKLRGKVAGVLQIYDQILGKQKYIGGASFTIADLYHMPHMITLEKLGEGDHLWKGLSNVEKMVQGDF